MIRSPNFAPYFVGNAASASGTWFQNLAASILVFRLTGSPFLLGVLNFCQFVPVLVLSLAKRIEEVFVPGRAEPILLPRESPALQLLQRIRDEGRDPPEVGLPAAGGG